MTLQEIAATLEAITGMTGKVSYRFFPEGEAPALPFICYYQEGTDNFPADGIVFNEIKRIAVELYTLRKDPTTEGRVEAALTTAGFFWEKTETFVEDEKCYLIIYTFEV